MGKINTRMKTRILLFFLAALFSCGEVIAVKLDYAIVISANAEWRIVTKRYSSEKLLSSPWGDYFFSNIKVRGKIDKVLFFHEGWGKVAAAGGTQYVIDHFNPDIIINIGTCGGFEGRADILDVILVEKTVIYDIKEAMGDSREAIEEYTTTLDLSWLTGGDYPSKVKRSLLVSADRDLIPSEISRLSGEYDAAAGDWESGAIAYVCTRNHKKCIILRGVTDIVTSTSGEAYNNISLFEYRTDLLMSRLIDQLPSWLDYLEKGKHN